MINPNNKYVGLGNFINYNAKYLDTLAGEFSKTSDSLDGSYLPVAENIIQKLEVKDSYLTYIIDCDDDIPVGVDTTAKVRVNLLGSDKMIADVLDSGYSYASSDETVATVSNDGVITALKEGTVTIKVSKDGNVIISKDITVRCNHDYTYTKSGFTYTRKCSKCGDEKSFIYYIYWSRESTFASNIGQPSSNNIGDTLYMWPVYQDSSFNTLEGEIDVESSNSDIVSVTKTGYFSMVKLEFKKNGTATLHVVPKDDPKLARDIVIKVGDNAESDDKSETNTDTSTGDKSGTNTDTSTGDKSGTNTNTVANQSGVNGTNTNQSNTSDKTINGDKNADSNSNLDNKANSDKSDSENDNIPSITGTWQGEGTSKWFKADDGTYPTNKWVKIDGKNYYFDKTGYLAADEYATTTNPKTGATEILWFNSDGSQTYEGVMSWQSNATGWWVEDTAGWYPVNEWLKIDGKWYMFNEYGYMCENEWRDGYFLDSDGALSYEGVASWGVDVNGWWFGDNLGWYAANSWQKINGYWYYFNASGYMVTNTYIDGYWIAADGVCY